MSSIIIVDMAPAVVVSDDEGAAVMEVSHDASHDCIAIQTGQLRWIHRIRYPHPTQGTRPSDGWVMDPLTISPDRGDLPGT